MGSWIMLSTARIKEKSTVFVLLNFSTLYRITVWWLPIILLYLLTFSLLISEGTNTQYSKLFHYLDSFLLAVVTADGRTLQKHCCSFSGWSRDAKCWRGSILQHGVIHLVDVLRNLRGSTLERQLWNRTGESYNKRKKSLTFSNW